MDILVSFITKIFYNVRYIKLISGHELDNYLFATYYAYILEQHEHALFVTLVTT